MYVYHRSNRSILNQIISQQGAGIEWDNQYINVVERGYRPVLGVMWSPADKWTIGLSLAKTFLYNESYSIQNTTKAATVSNPATMFDSIPGKRKFPIEIRGGVAYFASSSFLISADASYYTKVTDANFGDRVAVLNGALGAEYYLNKNWAVRGGVFSNLANTPELQSGRVNQDERVDLYGVSASISSFSRNTSITFGTNYTTGSGKAQIIGDVSNIQDVKEEGWMIFVSSSYSY